MKEVKGLKPFGKFIMTIGQLPASYLVSMTYEEQLIWLCNYLQNVVIPTVNNNGEAVEELQNLYIQLKDYVDNYFENLDVQEEINNKLDDMAESGELAEIIATFLDVGVLFVYDTASDLAGAENLSDGASAYILGKDTYNDGKGAFYKIREITLSDVVDGDNIIAITATEDLVAEKLPNYRLNEIETTLGTLVDTTIPNIQGDINTINNTTIPGVENDVDSLTEYVRDNKTIDTKFTYVSDPYYPALNFGSNIHGLPFEPANNASSGLSVQGCALNTATGEVVYNNGTEIYTLDNSAAATKRVLYSNTFGHGGDCCIVNNMIYISDSQDNKIYVVNLANGNKTTISLTNSEIANETYPAYTPVLAGICMDNDDSYCYILVQDEENNDHTVKSGSTLRLYKYDFDSTYTKLYEVTQDVCYIQGLTKDKDYFYFVGNKPFTTTYTGNKLYIVKTYDYSLFDVLENNSTYEHEGLDYGYRDGIEGLITVCGNSGSFIRSGILAFNGDCSRSKQFYIDGDNRGWAVKSRGGLVTCYAYIKQSINGDQTVTVSNFFANTYPLKLANEVATMWELIAQNYVGSSRNCTGQAAWDYSNNNLIIRTGTSSPATTYALACFIYVSD